MYTYRRLDLNPVALANYAVGTQTSAQIQVFRGAINDIVDGSTASFLESGGPMFHLNGVLMISSVGAAGTGNLIVQGLVPGQDGTQPYHWRTLGQTNAQTTTGAFVIQITGPIPVIVRLQLVVAGNAITAGGWLELGA